MAIMNTNWQLLLSPDSDVPPDVFFVVTTAEHPESEGKSIGAHRFLLSCVSSVFRGMFLGPMKERGDVIKVEDTTHEAFQTMISFIYQVPGQDFNLKDINCPQRLFELLAVAERYEILSLKTLASHALGSLSISDENLIFCATVAKQYKIFEDESKKLLQRCLSFIKGRDTFTLISETKKNFPDASLDVLYELLDVVLPLSSPEPDFEHDGYTLSGCLLLHRLIVTGQTGELVRRKRELVPSLLSHTCGEEEAKVRLKLKMIEV